LRLLTNFLSLAGGESLSKLFTFAAVVYVARVAGPTGFGYLEFAGSITLCAGLLVDQGLGMYGAREIARSPRSTSALVNEIIFVRFSLTILAFAGVALLVFLMDRPALSERLVLLYGLSLLPMPLMLQWVFQGHDQMRTVALMQVLRQGTYAVVVFALLRDSQRLWPVATAEIAGVAAVAVFSIWAYGRYFRERLRPRVTFSAQLIREAATIGMSQIFWSMRVFGSTVVLGLVASGEEVGFFGAAMRVLIGLHVFVWLYFFNLLPSLSRRWSEGGGSFQRLIDQSTHATAWLSLGAGALWILLAPVAVRIIYGAAFDPAIPALQWLSGVCVIAAISGHFRYGLIAANRQRDEMIASAIGALVTLPLIPFAYRLLGVPGAAIALVAGDCAVWISTWIFSRRHLHLSGHLRHLIRPALCAASVLAVAWILLPGTEFAFARVLVASVGFAVAAYMSDSWVRRTTRQIAARFSLGFEG
jgi:PST family polysaccharide transporter